MSKTLPPKINLTQVQSLIPAANDDEFEALRKDIVENGLQLPIVMHGDVVVDGRARLKVCQLEGIKPLVIDISTMPNASNDPAMVALSLNLNRRHILT